MGQRISGLIKAVGQPGGVNLGESAIFQQTVDMFKAKVVRVNKLLRKKAIDIGVASGVIRSHKGYQKFIIMGMPRSGSNFLASSLRSRRNIVAYGELFSEQSRKRRDILWDTPGYETTRKALTLRDKDPIAFLESMVFKRMPAYVEAVGFKLFYHHADENWQCVWPYLKAQDVKVIHLKRRNYLKVFLSMSNAMRTRQFVSRNREKSSQQPITLDYNKCLDWFEMTRAWETKFDTYFDDSLEIYYEDLAKDYTQNMRTIQEYLNVRVGETHSPLRQQARLPLNKAITNYAELKSRFASSEWAEFFECGKRA